MARDFAQAAAEIALDTRWSQLTGRLVSASADESFGSFWPRTTAAYVRAPGGSAMGGNQPGRSDACPPRADAGCGRLAQ